eukprot:COSAG04_NODE_2438_length_4122_cov_20.274422_2_plen_607_part_01
MQTEKLGMWTVDSDWVPPTPPARRPRRPLTPWLAAKKAGGTPKSAPKRAAGRRRPAGGEAPARRLLQTPHKPRTGAAPNAEPAELEPQTIESEQPASTTTHGGAARQTDEGLDPTVAEYIRDGISAAGVLRAIELFEDQLAEGATTSDLCQQHIKPRTMPPGWRDEPELIRFDEDGKDVSMNGWYKHTYVREAGGERTPRPPPGTRSMCRLFAADPATAHLVGKPTHFLSHAWKYEIRNLAAALRSFVEGLPEGSPPAFFWFDCFSLDQHAQSSQGSEWWRTTFMQAIGSMGHTVMMLSPWDDPIPLTRAWCLWELHCTVATGATFSVCLGPAEQAAFEKTILSSGFNQILEAFARIDVANAEAGNPHDKAMIMEQAEAGAGGLEGLNATAVGTLRRWFVGYVVGLGRRVRGTGGGGFRPFEARHRRREGAGSMMAVANGLMQMGGQEEAIELYEAAAAGYEAAGDAENAAVARSNLALSLMALKRHAEARPLLEAVLAFRTERHGAEHEHTLSTRGDLATCVDEMGDAEGAMREREAVLAARTRTLGPTHRSTLVSRQNLATSYSNAGGYERAAREHEAVVEGYTATLGPRHADTLMAQANLGYAR